MIGIGIDIIETERLRASMEGHGKAFLSHVFTEEEQAKAPSHEKARLDYYAGRWAAKEAVAKALGTGFGPECAWLDLHIENLPSGQPVVVLTGTAAATAARLGIRAIHISISHDVHYAVAQAIAE